MNHTPIQWRDAVGSTATEIAKCMLNLDGATVGDPTSTPQDTEAMVGAHIALVGKRSFEVTLASTKAGCEWLAKAVLGFSEKDAIDARTIADAVGELVNMLGGGIKRRIGADLELGLPVFVTGIPQPSDRQSYLAIPLLLGTTNAYVIVVGPHVP